VASEIDALSEAGERKASSGVSANALLDARTALFAHELLEVPVAAGELAGGARELPAAEGLGLDERAGGRALGAVDVGHARLDLVEPAVDLVVWENSSAQRPYSESLDFSRPSSRSETGWIVTKGRKCSSRARSCSCGMSVTTVGSTKRPFANSPSVRTFPPVRTVPSASACSVIS
jgi:hypothetical protein